MTSHHGTHQLSLLMGVLMLLFVGVGASGRTLYVSPDGSGMGGESWSTAYKSILSCVEASDPGDMIWIKHGTYDESIWVASSVTIIGGFAGTETDISAETIQKNSLKTIVSPKSFNSPGLMIESSCSIRGITIQEAHTAGITVFAHAKPVVEKCVIKGNSSPTVGGGFAITSASPEIIDCTITNNTAAINGGGLYIVGSSNVLLQNCLIENNKANNEGAQGGGILFGASSLIIENCRIQGNFAKGSNLYDYEAHGGGLFTTVGHVLLQNTLITGNIAEDYGSQIYAMENASFIAHNCTIYGGERAISWSKDPPSFINSILWGSNGMCVPHMESTGDPDVTYSCIQGGYPGLGNISDDPLFRNAATGDYRLLPESPCIDTAGTSGPDDDLNGYPRPVDIAGIGREVTDTYDMGAYEFQLNELPTPTPTQAPAGVDLGHTNLYQ